ncbi:MAG: pPIWI_RE module domain-containing protein [Nostoc sp.]
MTQAQEQLPPIDRLQTLAWLFNDNFDPLVMGEVYGLRLPVTWIDIIKGLADVDHTPPILSLYAVLRGCASDIIYIFPKSFSRLPEERPEYWIIVHTYSDLIDLNQFWAIIQNWLSVNYDLKVVKSVLAEIESGRAELNWELINLKNAPFDVLEVVLPELIARWLTRKGFQLGLRNANGHEEYWPLVVSPSTGKEAYLVTWPPINYSPSNNSEQVARYSYYLKFYIAPPNGKTPYLLLFQAGIRRYISKPMTAWDNPGNQPLPGARQKIFLPKGEDSSVYVAMENLGWLKPNSDPSVERETTLINLKLMRHDSVIWKARIDKILTMIAPHIDIPEPMQFLSDPAKYAPQYLLSHRTRLGSHPVGVGLEPADRFELFERLTTALPPGVVAAPIINKIDFSHCRKRRLSKPKETSTISDQVYRIRISSNSVNTLLEVLREFLESKQVQGTVQEIDNETYNFTNSLGESYLLKVDKTPLPNEWLSPLSLGGSYSGQAKAAASKNRARLIERQLVTQPKPSNEKRGILIELVDYRKFDKQRRLTDPKAAIRWGHAYASWVSQFLQPETEYINPEDFAPIDSNDEKQVKTYESKKNKLNTQKKAYKARCLNAILDLMRQLNFPLGIPFYKGFYQTSLPHNLDIIAIRIIRLNARNKGEIKVVIPILIKIPSENNSSQMQVCLPGDYGPTWMPYDESLFTVAMFEQKYNSNYTSEQIKNFVGRAFADLEIKNPTLLLLDDQNLRQDLPSLLKLVSGDEAKDPNNLWHQNKLLSCQNPQLLRVARLRYSSDGLVAHVCPISGFNRYSGIYHNPDFSSAFYSIGRSPQSAKRPANSRQRDRVSKPGWNQSALEISWLSLQSEDKPEEWTLIVHRLREASPFIDAEIVTLLPQPVHSGKQISEYISRSNVEEDFDDFEDDLLDESLTEQAPEYIQLSLF